MPFPQPGSVPSKTPSGRQKVTTPSEEKYNKLSSLRDRNLNPSQLQSSLKNARLQLAKVL